MVRDRASYFCCSSPVFSFIGAIIHLAQLLVRIQQCSKATTDGKLSEVNDDADETESKTSATETCSLGP